MLAITFVHTVGRNHHAETLSVCFFVTREYNCDWTVDVSNHFVLQTVFFNERKINETTVFSISCECTLSSSDEVTENQVVLIVFFYSVNLSFEWSSTSDLVVHVKYVDTTESIRRCWLFNIKSHTVPTLCVLTEPVAVLATISISSTSEGNHTTTTLEVVRLFACTSAEELWRKVAVNCVFTTHKFCTWVIVVVSKTWVILSLMGLLVDVS